MIYEIKSSKNPDVKLKEENVFQNPITNNKTAYMMECIPFNVAWCIMQYLVC